MDNVIKIVQISKWEIENIQLGKDLKEEIKLTLII